MEYTDIEFVARLLAIPLALVLDPFAVLLVLGLALRMGWINDPILTRPELAGFASPAFITITGVLYVLHALADKIPPIGHLFDAIGIVAKPLAGAFVGLFLANKLDHGTTIHWIAMAVVLFGGIPAAASLQLARTKVRLAASAGSVGTLHPIASTAENFVALPVSALAVLRPELALALIALIVVPLLWIALRVIRAMARRAKRIGRGVKSTTLKALRPQPMERTTSFP